MVLPGSKVIAASSFSGRVTPARDAQWSQILILLIVMMHCQNIIKAVP